MSANGQYTGRVSACEHDSCVNYSRKSTPAPERTMRKKVKAFVQLRHVHGPQHSGRNAKCTLGAKSVRTTKQNAY